VLPPSWPDTCSTSDNLFIYDEVMLFVLKKPPQLHHSYREIQALIVHEPSKVFHTFCLFVLLTPNYPTVPSSDTDSSFCASTANSMGSLLSTSLA